MRQSLSLVGGSREDLVRRSESNITLMSVIVIGWVKYIVLTVAKHAARMI